MTPRQAGFRMPAEWVPHAGTWVAWPSHEDLWQENLGPVRSAFARLVATIAESETAEVLVPDPAEEKLARAALPGRRVRFHVIPFGDIWLRDTSPIFLTSEAGDRACVRFGFNGWGGKYVLDHDDRVAERIAGRVEGLRAFTMPLVLEGGAVDVDGEGSVLTTRQCLLNRNRNPSLTEREIETALLDSLGCEKVLWLGEGLINDHTDGHVDTIARFVRPGTIIAMTPHAKDDPNDSVLRGILREAEGLVDAKGRRIEVVRIPSPGRVVDRDGRVMPASYVNFYLTNAAVLVPTYGSPFDDEAVERVASLFPGRKGIGIDACALLTGGGAIHCITQQEPRVGSG
ncbi:MAG: agmatine deiminase family protein [Polyangiaceae bacterium]